MIVKRFTLLEITVVLLLIGVVAGLAIKNIVETAEVARVKATESAMSNLAGSLDQFKLYRGTYPSQEDGLEALVAKHPSVLKHVPKDGWNNELLYFREGGSSPFRLVSLGSDGQEGGEGFAADLEYPKP